ncbi:LysR family transcriptional regulator [Pelagibius sp. Alg239-R121]|uniref:LysR family transcriptional regulator n=1 Tax=Pelagibius sp. Alg239-R121 TaxID=2993448 RepID=UPI0024A6F45B|nr:LysR family transcriptional regulator [Pelagibius sp. Alg239-R121]
MDKPEHLAIDFNALRTLRLVYDLGSFSAAADKLGHNQSTISYTIDRLRRAFDDPLFVRQGKGVAATDRCLEIVDQAGRMLDEFEALAAPKSFDPSSAAGTLVLSCNYYERAVILPGFVRALRKLAPNLQLRVIQSSVKGDVLLKNGDCDLLLSPMQVAGSEVFRRRIYNDHYVCIMDRANPLAGKVLDLEAYERSDHIVVTYDGGWRPLYLDALEARGVHLKAALDLPSLGELEGMIQGTDLISTVPKRIADSFSDEIAVRPCPVDVELGIDLYWTARSHHSAMNKWIRRLIVDSIGRQGG